MLGFVLKVVVLGNSCTHVTWASLRSESSSSPSAQVIRVLLAGKASQMCHDSELIVQYILGSEGLAHARKCLAYRNIFNLNPSES